MTIIHSTNASSKYCPPLPVNRPHVNQNVSQYTPTHLSCPKMSLEDHEYRLWIAHRHPWQLCKCVGIFFGSSEAGHIFRSADQQVLLVKVSDTLKIMNTYVLF